jgi:hypothetical protein
MFTIQLFKLIADNEETSYHRLLQKTIVSNDADCLRTWKKQLNTYKITFAHIKEYRNNLFGHLGIDPVDFESLLGLENVDYNGLISLLDKILMKSSYKAVKLLSGRIIS